MVFQCYPHSIHPYLCAVARKQVVLARVLRDFCQDSALFEPSSWTRHSLMCCWSDCYACGQDATSSFPAGIHPADDAVINFFGAASRPTTLRSMSWTSTAMPSLTNASPPHSTVSRYTRFKSVGYARGWVSSFESFLKLLRLCESGHGYACWNKLVTSQERFDSVSGLQLTPTYTMPLNLLYCNAQGCFILLSQL